ncbi:MAG TPA: sugar ABC transporter permease, partial [bacterium (Candidatus Stahlbacteria)]|nr:sugar ABC transporter permease [Candidatus Stahlbacteria bacterium]
NYINIFKDPLFYKSLKVTFIYTIFAVPLGLFFGLLIALLMNQGVRGITIFRTIYYLPAILSGVAVAVLWQKIFNPYFGVLNPILKKLHIMPILELINSPVTWLYSEFWALPAFIIMSLWGVGGSMIIYLAGLQGIPTHLYEAAEIDGASAFGRFRHVTIPMLSPIIFFNLIMGIIGSFQVFVSSYVMTGGGPNNATLFYVLNLYRQAFQYYRMGYGCALAWLLFTIIIGFTLIIWKSSPLWVYYAGEIRGRR